MMHFSGSISWLATCEAVCNRFRDIADILYVKLLFLVVGLLVFCSAVDLVVFSFCCVIWKS